MKGEEIMKKRILSTFLVLIMAAGIIIPATSSAETGALEYTVSDLVLLLPETGSAASRLTYLSRNKTTTALNS